jgi:hypothetical protein
MRSRTPPADADVLDDLFVPEDRPRVTPAVARWLRALLGQGDRAEEKENGGTTPQKPKRIK